MKYVFLYAGQGAQKVGMGKDLYDKYETYRKIADSFSFEFDHRRLMHEGPLEELSKTEYTQPCMAVFAAGVTALLRERGISPSAALGLSLGEYGALHAAGVFDAKEYVNLTRYRGQVMAEAAEGCECAMSAILGTNAETVEALCKKHFSEGYVTVANYNCPGQYVICGDETAVCAVEREAKENGAGRCVRLNVSGPFHTSYMKSAGEELRMYLRNMELKRPEIPVMLNYTGECLRKDEDIREMLVKQVQNSVRMEESLKKALSFDADLFIEIGPGNTLAGFLKKCAKECGKEVKVVSIQTADDLERLFAR